MKRNFKSKHKPLIITMAVSLALVIVLAATFAWFTASDSKTNHFETQITDGSVSIFELFTPPTDWKPGQEVTKQVAVTNTGETDVLARVSFEEVLRLLGNDAEQHPRASATPADGDIPVNMKVTPAEWKTLTELGLTSTTVPAGATVLGKKETLSNRTTYAFIIFYPTTYTKTNLDGTTTLPQPINHKMTAGFSVTGTELTVSNAEYYYYTKKIATQKDWAGIKAMDGVTFIHPDNNIKVGKAPYDATAGVGPITVTPQILADVKKLLSDSNIGLIYGSNFINSADVTSVSTDKWRYNEDDGYFYYLGKITSGTTTPNLLEKMVLDETAGAKYGMMDLDLIVCMEAIQNTTDAIQSSTGWGIDPTSDIYTRLAAFCEY